MIAHKDKEGGPKGFFEDLDELNSIGIDVRTLTAADLSSDVRTFIKNNLAKDGWLAPRRQDRTVYVRGFLSPEKDIFLVADKKIVELASVDTWSLYENSGGRGLVSNNSLLFFRNDTDLFGAKIGDLLSVTRRAVQLFKSGVSSNMIQAGVIAVDEWSAPISQNIIDDAYSSGGVSVLSDEQKTYPLIPAKGYAGPTVRDGSTQNCDEFKLQHGRDRYPGEPPEGFRVKIFKDEPIVLGSFIDVAPARLELCVTIQNIGDHGGLVLNTQTPNNTENTLILDVDVLKYLNKLSARQFSERYENIDNIYGPFWVVDSFFERPFPDKHVPIIQDFLSTRGITGAVDVRGDLFLKTKSGETRVTSDRSDKMRDFFVAQVLMGQKPKQLREKGPTEPNTPGFER